MDINFEHRFWLQILGDHLRFIENSLAAKEVELLERAKSLKVHLDELLISARQNKNIRTEPILSAVNDVKNLKQTILARQISGKIEISLPPTFLNHMLNELNSFEKILTEPDFIPHVLESHYLWSSDAAGHAIALIQSLDPVEKALMKELKKIKKSFSAVFNKTIEFTGYFRSGVTDFPAIDKLNQEAIVELQIFMNMLETIREERLDLTLLGRLNPLIADHMLRESVYYLSKISPD